MQCEDLTKDSVDHERNQLNEIERNQLRNGHCKSRLIYSCGERKKRKKTQKPPPTFHGMSSWEAFLAQFNIVACPSGWDNEEKTAFLATSLQSNATLILSNLSEEDRKKYSVLVAALS